MNPPSDLVLGTVEIEILDAASPYGRSTSSRRVTSAAMAARPGPR
ncbi:hypothetical protein ACFVY1_35210 [Streptomyces sp. NPDC058293]